MPDVSRTANGMERQRPKRSGTFSPQAMAAILSSDWSMARLAQATMFLLMPRSNKPMDCCSRKD
jgi:hypothetical protein